MPSYGFHFLRKRHLTIKIMGLDQYAYVKNLKTEEESEFGYWRKHNALQGWMENLWRSKGCPNKEKYSEDFNCIPLDLTHEDLDALEEDLLDSRLPETTGFFFGSSTAEDNPHLEEDLDFVSQARQHLDSGLEVKYFSWW